MSLRTYVLSAFAISVVLFLSIVDGQANVISHLNPQLRVTCESVHLKMPAGFGNGSWRFSSVRVSYPSMSPAQFNYVAKHIRGTCEKRQPTAVGYRIGTFHFTVHGPVSAKVTMVGCSPDGHRVYINMPVQLPHPRGQITLSRSDVDVRGRCG